MRTVGGRRERAGAHAPEAVLRATGLVGRLAVQAAEQAFVHRLQHLRMADRRHQRTARRLDAQQLPGGEVGEDQPAVGGVLRVAGRHDHHRVRQAVDQGCEGRLVRLRLGDVDGFNRHVWRFLRRLGEAMRRVRVRYRVERFQDS